MAGAGTTVGLVRAHVLTPLGVGEVAAGEAARGRPPRLDIKMPEPYRPVLAPEERIPVGPKATLVTPPLWYSRGSPSRAAPDSPSRQSRTVPSPPPEARVPSGPKAKLVRQ